MFSCLDITIKILQFKQYNWMSFLISVLKDFYSYLCKQHLEKMTKIGRFSSTLLRAHQNNFFFFFPIQVVSF